MSPSRRDLDQFDAWDAGDVGTPQQSENPLLMVHRALRGRYLLATAVALTLGLAGAAAGMKSQKPTYVSTGVVNVLPSPAVAMYEIDERLPMPAFEAFVQQEASTMTSRRVLSAANTEITRKAAQQNLQWPDGPNEGIVRISNALEVRTPRRTNQIILAASSTSKTEAYLIADNVLKTYQEQNEADARRDWRRRMEALESVQTELKGSFDRVAGDLNDAYRQYGGLEAFEKSYAEKRAELIELSRSQTQVNLELAAFEGRARNDAAAGGAGNSDPIADDEGIDPPASTPDASAGAAGVSDDGQTVDARTDNGNSGPEDEPERIPDQVIELLAVTDEQLNDLIRERDNLGRRLAAVEKQVSPRHREYRRLSNQIKTLSTKVELRAKELQARPEDNPSGLDVGASDIAASLAGRIKFLETRISEVRAQITRYDEVRANAANSTVELDRLQRNLAQVNERILQLEAEDKASGGAIIDKLEYGEADPPLRPTGDKSKQFAAAGFMAGFGGTYAAFIAFGLAFPRLRTGDDVAASVSDVAVLGMIPELDGDEEQKLIARECVHLLRTMIEASETSEFPMLTLTSPVSGVGKSTIAFMLAESFAASGRKVLLIDADLTGRGLTARFGLEQRLGLSDNHGGTAKELAVSVNGNGLCVIGGGTAFDGAERMCRSRLEQLIDSARDDFDMAIVDTGPILGSIEAASVVPISDRVLLVAARGMESRMLRIAVERLTSLRAKRVGIVFNRARPFDIVRSVSSQSAHRLRSRPDQGAAAGPIDGPVDGRVDGRGPIEKEAG